MIFMMIFSVNILILVIKILDFYMKIFNDFLYDFLDDS